MKQTTIVLEDTGHVHELTANNIIETSIEGELGGKVLNISGPGIVTHGEHKTLVTESPVVIKINQQEMNPITKKLQNAFD